MKVAFVLGTSTGGTARHVRMLAGGYAARGVAAEVFGPAQTDRDFAFSAQAGFTPVEIADRPRLLHDLRAIARLRRLIRGLAARRDARAWPAGRGAHRDRSGVRPAGRLPSPACPGGHRAQRPAPGGATGAIYSVLELIVARTADSVLCVSPDLEQRMRTAGARRVGRALVPADAVPVSTVTPVPGAVGQSVQETFPRKRARFLVLIRAARWCLPSGRLAAQKGFGTLLDAAASWRDMRPEPVLVVVGEGPLEAELKSQAARLKLDVRFPGHRDDAPALLASAAVFVLPSAWEGQPLILQEALRVGCAHRRHPRLLHAGTHRRGRGPARSSGEVARLADAVRAALTDPALAARLRQAAAYRARALPTEDDAVTAALAEYDLLTQTRR